MFEQLYGYINPPEIPANPFQNVQSDFLENAGSYFQFQNEDVVQSSLPGTVLDFGGPEGTTFIPPPDPFSQFSQPFDSGTSGAYDSFWDHPVTSMRDWLNQQLGYGGMPSPMETTNLPPAAGDASLHSRDNAEIAAERLRELLQPRNWYDPGNIYGSAWGETVGTPEEIATARAELEQATRDWYNESRLAANSAADQMNTAQGEAQRVLERAGTTDGLLNNPTWQSDLNRATGDAQFYEQVTRASSQQAGEAFAFAQQHGIDLNTPPPEPESGSLGKPPTPDTPITIVSAEEFARMQPQPPPPPPTPAPANPTGANIADGGLNIPPDPLPRENPPPPAPTENPNRVTENNPRPSGGNPRGGSTGDNPNQNNIPGAGSGGPRPTLAELLRALLPSLAAQASNPSPRGVQNRTAPPPTFTPTRPPALVTPNGVVVDPQSPLSPRPSTPPTQNTGQQNRQALQNALNQLTENLRRLAGLSELPPSANNLPPTTGSVPPPSDIPGTLIDIPGLVNNASAPPNTSGEPAPEQGPRPNVEIGGEGSPFDIDLPEGICPGNSCIVLITGTLPPSGQQPPADMPPTAPPQGGQLLPGAPVGGPPQTAEQREAEARRLADEALDRQPVAMRALMDEVDSQSEREVQAEADRRAALSPLGRFLESVGSFVGSANARGTPLHVVEGVPRDQAADRLVAETDAACRGFGYDVRTCVPLVMALYGAETGELHPDAVGPPTRYGRAVNMGQILPSTARSLFTNGRIGPVLRQRFPELRTGADLVNALSGRAPDRGWRASVWTSVAHLVNSCNNGRCSIEARVFDYNRASWYVNGVVRGMRDVQAGGPPRTANPRESTPRRTPLWDAVARSMRTYMAQGYRTNGATTIPPTAPPPAPPAPPAPPPNTADAPPGSGEPAINRNLGPIVASIPGARTGASLPPGGFNVPLADGPSAPPAPPASSQQPPSEQQTRTRTQLEAARARIGAINTAIRGVQGIQTLVARTNAALAVARAGVSSMSAPDQNGRNTIQRGVNAAREIGRSLQGVVDGLPQDQRRNIGDLPARVSRYATSLGELNSLSGYSLLRAAETAVRDGQALVTEVNQITGGAERGLNSANTNMQTEITRLERALTQLEANASSAAAPPPPRTETAAAPPPAPPAPPADPPAPPAPAARTAAILPPRDLPPAPPAPPGPPSPPAGDPNGDPNESRRTDPPARPPPPPINWSALLSAQPQGVTGGAGAGNAPRDNGQGTGSGPNTGEGTGDGGSGGGNGNGAGIANGGIDFGGDGQPQPRMGLNGGENIPPDPLRPTVRVVRTEAYTLPPADPGAPSDPAAPPCSGLECASDMLRERIGPGSEFGERYIRPALDGISNAAVTACDYTACGLYRNVRDAIYGPNDIAQTGAPSGGNTGESFWTEEDAEETRARLGLNPPMTPPDTSAAPPSAPPPLSSISPAVAGFVQRDEPAPDLSRPVVTTLTPPPADPAAPPPPVPPPQPTADPTPTPAARPAPTPTPTPAPAPAPSPRVPPPAQVPPPSGLGGLFGSSNSLSSLGQMLQALGQYLALTQAQNQAQMPRASMPPMVMTPPTTQTQRPSVALVANPQSIAVGSTSRLTWTSFRATSCVVRNNGAVVASGSASGSAATPTLSQTTTFTLSCSGTSGTRDAQTTVYVGEQPPASPRTSGFGVTTGTNASASAPSQTSSGSSAFCDPAGSTDVFIACLNALPGSSNPVQ